MGCIDCYQYSVMCHGDTMKELNSLTFQLTEAPVHLQRAGLLGAGLVQQVWHKGVCPSGRPVSSLTRAVTGWTRPDRK